jgi:hypothetical protein
VTKLGPQSINESRDYGLKVSGRGGASLAGLFDNSETFSAKIWVGDDRAGTALAAEWDADPSALASPTVKLTVAAATIGSLTPGKYYVQVLINPSTDKVPVLETGSTIELTAGGGGTATASATYASLDDVRRFAPWIDEAIVKHGSVQLDLNEILARARTIIDDRITSGYVAAVRAGVVQRTITETYLMVDTTSTEIRSYLDADALMVAGGRGAVVKEISARLAIAMVCEGLLGGPDDRTTWGRLGTFSRSRAESLLSGFRAELDTDSDGEVDLIVPLGIRCSR